MIPPQAQLLWDNRFANWLTCADWYLNLELVHICAGKQLCERPLCVQGMPLNCGLVHGAWFSMLRRRIADVNPLHVHGDCSYRGAYNHHLPLWYRPTNMRQAGSQTKLLHVKANVVPSHLRVLHGTILLICAKTCSPRKIGLCLGSRHLGRIQAHQGK
jgi:hypothetical protein